MMPGRRTPFRAELIVDGISLARVKTDAVGNVLVSLGHGAYQETVMPRRQALELAHALIAAAAAAHRPPSQITVNLGCQECLHEQSATSASMVLKPGGDPSYLFGPSYRRCDNCGGPLEEISHAPGT